MQWRQIPDLEMLSQQFLSDWSIKSGTAKYLPDFAGGGHYVVVSDRAKTIIEKHDIGHSRFAPLHIFERPDLSPVDGLWHYWILTHPLQLKKETRDRKKILRTSSRMDIDVAWEVANNQDFRNYISRFPFWCRWAIGGKIAVRRDVFIAMKEAGLTGLNEVASGSFIGREPNETVGHLI